MEKLLHTIRWYAIHLHFTVTKQWENKTIPQKQWHDTAADEGNNWRTIMRNKNYNRTNDVMLRWTINIGKNVEEHAYCNYTYWNIIGFIQERTYCLQIIGECRKCNKNSLFEALVSCYLKNIKWKIFAHNASKYMVNIQFLSSIVFHILRFNRRLFLLRSHSCLLSQNLVLPTPIPLWFSCTI